LSYPEREDAVVQLTPGALGTSLTVLGLALGCAPLASPTRGPAERPDIAIWVYGADRWSGAEQEAHLARLATLARRLYLSVEDGPRLLVDEPDSAQRLGDLVDRATERFGLVVEAMLLQDPSWVGDPEGAVDRVRRVVRFDAARRASGRPGFAGFHFDIEPHSEEAWACASAAARAATLRRLQAVFRRARAIAHEHTPRPPTLSAALPWWLGPLSIEVPDAAPAAWLADLDEVVLMVYGDPGGPLVGESVPAVLRRVDDARLWRTLPAERGLRIGLATFEHKDVGALRGTIAGVTAALGARPGFRGVAIFANDQVYDAPLAAFVEGRVLDEGGLPVAGAHLRAADQEADANRCGGFGLKALPIAGTELEVTAQGFRPARLRVGPLAPGRVRELPPIRLERAP
jgi:hypothetical protein